MSEKPLLTPYLNFNGETAEAMRFYKSALGGDLTMQTYGEAKMGKGDAENARIIHAALRSDMITLMAADGPLDRTTKSGDNIHLSLSGSGDKYLSDAFRALSEGGKVDTPMAKQFWGDTFGMLTDKFGIHWMVNITAPPQK